MGCQTCGRPEVKLVIATVRENGSMMFLGGYCTSDHLIDDVNQNWERTHP